mmetsp:Transcript_59272/g.139586  ORF Transcript_59272/g.139586 Transcript_59272/m.139586 type:complete len:204 (+) Transcript_59272:287-898(+)
MNPFEVSLIFSISPLATFSAASLSIFTFWISLPAFPTSAFKALMCSALFSISSLNCATSSESTAPWLSLTASISLITSAVFSSALCSSSARSNCACWLSMSSCCTDMRSCFTPSISLRMAASRLAACPRSSSSLPALCACSSWRCWSWVSRAATLALSSSCSACIASAFAAACASLPLTLSCSASICASVASASASRVLSASS